MIIYGDGLNTTSQALGYSNKCAWKVGDIIQVPEYTPELGDYHEEYVISEIKNDPEDGLTAVVHYRGNSNDNI